MTAVGSRLFVWLQYLIPQHGLSRLVLAATRVRATWFKNLLIRGFSLLYAVNLGEAAQGDAAAYPCFNAFFTRALKPGLRPVAADPAIASPVDGAVSECGSLDGDRLLQAKGRYYSLADLTARQPWSSDFEGGSFATIYLAPFDYHRIHMPLDGELLDTLYVPGRLFSVNSATARHVPRLFARNERVVLRFAGPAGIWVLVMVGALNVGSMTTVWAGDITPARRRTLTRVPHGPVTLRKGMELGRFNMGSTVILLFERGHARWDPGLGPGSIVRMGGRLGDYTGTSS
jgi:phosphatidylserine decarboxylase